MHRNLSIYDISFPIDRLPLNGGEWVTVRNVEARDLAEAVAEAEYRLRCQGKRRMGNQYIASNRSEVITNGTF